MVVHRARRWGRASCWLACLSSCEFGVSLFVGGPEGADPTVNLAVALVFMFLPALGVWLFAFRPRLVLTHEAVTVVNPLRTIAIPVAALQGTAEEYAGLVISHHDADGERSTPVWCATAIAAEIDRLPTGGRPRPPATTSRELATANLAR